MPEPKDLKDYSKGKSSLNPEKKLVLIGAFGLLALTIGGCFIGDFFFATKLMDDAVLHTVLGGLLGFLASHAGKKQESE